MKNRYLNLALFLLMSSVSFAQSVYIYRNDDTRVRYNADDIADIDYYTSSERFFVDLQEADMNPITEPMLTASVFQRQIWTSSQVIAETPLLNCSITMIMVPST